MAHKTNICKICAHPDRDAIEKDIVQSGKTVTLIAKERGLARGTVTKHKLRCIPELLEAGRRAHDERQADRIIRLMNDMLKDVETAREIVLDAGAFVDEMEIFYEDDEKGNYKQRCAKWSALLKVAKEYRATLMDLARLTGDIQETITINVHQSEDFVEVREVILGAIADYPEARQAMNEALVAYVAMKSDDHSADTRH